MNSIGFLIKNCQLAILSPSFSFLCQLGGEADASASNACAHKWAQALLAGGDTPLGTPRSRFALNDRTMIPNLQSKRSHLRGAKPSRFASRQRRRPNFVGLLDQVPLPTFFAQC